MFRRHGIRPFLIFTLAAAAVAVEGREVGGDFDGRASVRGDRESTMGVAEGMNDRETRPSDNEESGAPFESEGKPVAKRPFCSQYHGCLGKRGLFGLAKPTTPTTMTPTKNLLRLLSKMSGKMADAEDDGSLNRESNLNRRQIWWGWPEDDAERKDRRQAMWAWPNDETRGKRFSARPVETWSNKEKLEIPPMRLPRLPEPVRPFTTRQSFNMWPSGQKRNVETEEQKTRIVKRKKRPFCSPYRGCITSNTDTEPNQRKVRSDTSFDTETRPKNLDYDYVPPEAINFFLSG